MTSASRFQKITLIMAASASALFCAGAWRAEAGAFIQTNLVSDIFGAGQVTDSELVNPWGVSHSTTSPFWVSNQGTSTDQPLAVTGRTNVTKVTAVNPPTGNIAIPTTGPWPSRTHRPSQQQQYRRLFRWETAGTAVPRVSSLPISTAPSPRWDARPDGLYPALTTPGAVLYRLGDQPGSDPAVTPRMTPGAGSIDVFDSSFARGQPRPPTHSAIPLRRPLVPFNVQDIDGNIYVTYAPSGLRSQEDCHRGAMAAVAVFDENGTLLQTLISGSKLASPWGIALAPGRFRPVRRRSAGRQFQLCRTARSTPSTR